MLQDLEMVLCFANCICFRATPTQQRYAIIEQEMLAVVFACQRFHHYFYEKKVEIGTDDKPLESIMRKELQNMPPQLQRMLLTLQKHGIERKYLAGKRAY